MSTPPVIEIFPSPPAAAGRPPRADGHRRLWVFLGGLTLCLASSLGYVWTREPLYQSTASLLTAAPEEAAQAPENAVRELSSPRQGLPPSINLAEHRGGGGIEHVAVQRQLLLGVPLLAETLRRLYQQAEFKDAPHLSPDDLHRLLSVDLVAETNMVELKAQGPQPKILAPLVNAWIDAYQGMREQTLQTATTKSHAALEAEARQLDQKVAAKREALERFRALYNIQAKTDADNTPLLRVKGLNEALNKAIDEQAKAKARLDAIRAAIARGEPVMPPKEAPGLENLEKRAQELREAQKDLSRRYTPAYLALHPQLKQIPGQLAQVEAEIRSKAEAGSHATLSEAEQGHLSTQQTVEELRRQIEAVKREASEFSNRFAEQETMKADLERLEEMRRAIQVDLAQAETRPQESYPPLQVVERAYPPTRPVWPDYWRDSGYAAAASLAFALVFVWLYEYLTRSEEPTAPAAMPNFQFYSVQGGLPPRQAEEEFLPPPQPAPPPALESPFPRELTEHEIRVLLEAADGGARRWIALLLSGLSVEETAGLHAENLDLTANRIRVIGERPRTLLLAPLLRDILSQPAGTHAAEVDAGEVEARIHCAAIDSGLPDAAGIDAAALRHTYLAYLVRQGIRLSELERIAGRVPARQLACYGRLSPPGPGLAAERVSVVHPVLQQISF